MEHPTRRDLDLAGFRVHAKVVSIVVSLALLVWTVRTLLRGEPDFFFPIIPIAVLVPLVGVHAARVYGRVPADADAPLRLPRMFRINDEDE